MRDRKDRRADIEAKLRQLADYQAKGLMRADEAAAQRAVLERQLLDAVLPDAPAPKPPARARLGAAAAMVVLVGLVSAWLVWGDAGLYPRTIAMLRVAQQRPGATGATTGASGAAAAGGPAGASSAGAPVDPHAWISGRIEVAPRLARKVADDASVFITLRHPGESGLPLAAVRKRADDLPIDFSIGPRDALGDPSRVTAASAPVVVEARVSASGRGLAQDGDLESDTPPAPLGSTGVRIVIDRVHEGS